MIANLFAVLFCVIVIILVVFVIQANRQSETLQHSKNDTISSPYRFSTIVPDNIETFDIPCELKPNQRLIYDMYTNNLVDIEFPDIFDEEKTNTNIPHSIIQTFISNTLPRNMFNAVSSILFSNLNFSYRFYNDQMARSFIQENFTNPKILKAFDILVPGAFRADIFRLCVLIIHGGFYLDVSFSVQYNDIGDMCKVLAQYPDIDLVIAKESKHTRKSGDSVYNAIIGSKPDHPVIKYILEKIVDRVLRRWWPPEHDYTALAFTGPVAFAHFYNEYYGKKHTTPISLGHDRARSVLVLEFEDGKIKDNDHVIFSNKYNMWRHDRPKGAHYTTLFAQKNVYRKLTSF